VKAIIKQIKGLALAGRSDSSHWVTMDAPGELGGASAGSRPMELMLMGIAGCTAMDVISILEKKRVRIENFEMEVEAERADQHPQIFTKIDLNYILYGDNIKLKDVERAIELTREKYCSATAMLKGVVVIKHHYRIETPKA